MSKRGMRFRKPSNLVWWKSNPRLSQSRKKPRFINPNRKLISSKFHYQWLIIRVKSKAQTLTSTWMILITKGQSAKLRKRKSKWPKGSQECHRNKKFSFQRSQSLIQVQTLPTRTAVRLAHQENKNWSLWSKLITNLLSLFREKMSNLLLTLALQLHPRSPKIWRNVILEANLVTNQLTTTTMQLQRGVLKKISST